jgi:hypothetical protein
MAVGQWTLPALPCPDCSDGGAQVIGRRVRQCLPHLQGRTCMHLLAGTMTRVLQQQPLVEWATAGSRQRPRP